MREKIRKFMKGRNGYDALSQCLIWLSFALLILSLLTSRLLNGMLSTVLWTVALAAIILSYVRVLSKNLYKRQAENAKYLGLVGRLRTRTRNLQMRWRDRKGYRYFRCPACNTFLRVPLGKGKIRIVCSRCGAKFERHT